MTPGSCGAYRLLSVALYDTLGNEKVPVLEVRTLDVLNEPILKEIHYFHTYGEVSRLRLFLKILNLFDEIAVRSLMIRRIRIPMLVEEALFMCKMGYGVNATYLSGNL